MPLHPQTRALLDQFAAAGGFDATQLPVPAVRELYAQMSVGRDVPAVASVVDRSVPGPAGDIPVRVYAPVAGRARPAIVYFHGGGFVIGSLDSHDGTCRALANASGCAVVSVDYRLAPEHRFPAAPEDCYAALRYVAERGSELGVDPRRLAVAGDSAGGNLAAAVAVASRQRGGPALVHQVLFYPALDARCDMPSCRSLSEGYMLTAAEMRWYWDSYLTSDADRENPLACPLRARDLGGLPGATVITAEYDPLRDDGETYAARLKEAGVPVELKRFDGVLHGFVLVAPLVDLAQGKEALAFAGASLRQAFAQSAPRA